MALGRLLTISRVTDTPGTYESVCVTDARSFTINNELVDITKPDCASPASKLAYAAQYGVQKLSSSGSGSWVNQAAQKAVVADAVGQVVREYKVDVPDVGTFVGDALLATTELSGDKTNELQANFSIEMSGAIVFTPAT